MSETLMEDFQTILDELEKEAPPPVSILADGEGYRPNAHFSVPVGGVASFGSSKPPSTQQNLYSQAQQANAPQSPLLQSKTQGKKPSLQAQKSEPQRKNNGAEG